MSKQKSLAVLLIIFFLSLIGWTFWLFEICIVKGWYSLSWLNGTLYSPYFGLLIAVFAFATPFLIAGLSLKKMILPIQLLYLVNFLCYEIGKQLCFALYCRFCFWETKDIVIIFLIAFLLFPLLGFLYWLITNKFIQKIKKISILYISLLTAAAIVLSMLSIYVNTGFGNQTGWVDCVKMGYPVLWTIFALGLSGIILKNSKPVIKVLG